MQRGHYVVLAGLGLLIAGSGWGLLVFFVGCLMCDPEQGRGRPVIYRRRRRR